MSKKVRAVFNEIFDNTDAADYIGDAEFDLRRIVDDSIEDYFSAMHETVKREQERILAAFMAIKKVRQALFDSLGCDEGNVTYQKGGKVVFSRDGTDYSLSLMEALKFILEIDA